MAPTFASFLHDIGDARHRYRHVPRLAGFTEYMRWSLLSFCLLLPLSAKACPDLSAFYQYADDARSQAELEAALSPLMSQCLRSSEFFALYGSAQMHSGKLAEALEMLERALLLDASNGAAQIDYAQALFLRGQLFSALDLNGQLLQREDIPAAIQPFLTEREHAWRAQTRQFAMRADVLAGYDDNLNGAPDPGQITLTLSGEPVILTLSPEYQAISGPYLNLGLGGQFRQLAADHQHDVSAQMRGRVSEDTGSDLVQLETRYNYLRPRRDHAWQLGAAMSHLFFGGNALYTAAEANARYQNEWGQSCIRHYDVASQYQRYHSFGNLNAVESKLTVGLDCPLSVAAKPSLLGLEFSLLGNAALNSGRPGGDRYGWQINAAWQAPLYRGVLSAQLNHTQLKDSSGYSAILDNGARRWLQRSYALLQYRQALQPGMAFVFNVYHQNQHSNLALFDSIDSNVEIGLNISF